MKNIKIGIIGLGGRGSMLLENEIFDMEDVEIAAVCDEYPDRAEKVARTVLERKGARPLCTTDYREVLALPQVEAVIVSTAWEMHIEIAIAALYAGKYVGMEVGGAYSVDDCWRLVRAAEETGMPCMLLENCCYGRREMMCLNLVKTGKLGEVVHCEGGYHHDLRAEITGGEENRHYRLRNYRLRNCENYPTHELGPIAKLLNLNHGNRMVSLTSTASRAAGLQDYIRRQKGAESPLAGLRFAQGDVITTVIRCAGGETITLTLDTTLPRFYSRGLCVHGTLGLYEEASDSLFFDGVNSLEDEYTWNKSWGNAEELAKTYDHPLWRAYQQEGVHKGHDGMDWLVLRAFFESAAAKMAMPIDVYDAAAWMCISTLSEASIAMGSAPVAIPDFTSGRWIKERPCQLLDTYRLDTIPASEIQL